MHCFTRYSDNSTTITTLTSLDREPSTRCSFCRSPHTGETVKSNSTFIPKNLDCLKCICNKYGSLSCKYGVNGLTKYVSCQSFEECGVIVEMITNGTVPYTCNQCVDRLGEQDLITRQPYDKWQVKIWSNSITCECLNTGEIVGVTNSVKIYGVESKAYCQNCTKMEAERFLKQPDSTYIFISVILTNKPIFFSWNSS